MIPISIDMSGMADGFDLSQEDNEGLVAYTVREIAAAFAREWEQEAKNSLSGARDEYTRGIVLGDRGRFTATVSLVGWLPNAIESGHSAFDMKDGFANSSKKKMKVGGMGWYLTIPFRFASAGALGESSVFSASLPPQVQAAAKKKDEQSPLGAPRGLTKGELPTQYQMPKSRKRIQLESKVFEEYRHKNSIYEGVKRDRKATGSQYMSFRRVSDNSDDMSWIHPGFIAKNLGNRAMGHLDLQYELDKAFNDYMSGIGF